MSCFENCKQMNDKIDDDSVVCLSADKFCDNFVTASLE